ncbi:DUF2800 domain-containing protein [Lysinibacillus sp.]|uniref:DUF2800 domain-containing protein n=1 Tax=Lysinibacillus sp. TaxID=1869345 RepID=UPI0028996A80|nr:DUF2800 domain-containing protein [Lysinibacillus sp.]
MTGHSERAHALLSASGSKRWLTCTPSARAEGLYMQELSNQGITEQESPFAEEGTQAHEYSEIILERELGTITKAQATRRINKFKKEKQYYGPEMEDMVEVYTDFVMERVNAARLETPDTLVLIEQRLDFSEWVPEGFGTGDVLIVRDGVLEIIDLKYGKGVAVDAHENPQLKLYALGAIAAHDVLYDIQEVRMTIVQPRLDNISTFEMSAEDLYKWANEEVKPKAEMADNGDGDYVPGEHCRFCKIKSTCRARADEALETAKAEFADDGSLEVNTPEPATLSDDELAEILFVVDDIEKWCKDIKAYALEQALNGTIYEGFKLVEGRSNRVITNEAKAIELLLEKGGVSKDDLYVPRKLETITNLEKKVGKKAFAEILEGVVIKPPGKPVLVTEDDKRPAIQSAESAANDFDDELLS